MVPRGVTPTQRVILDFATALGGRAPLSFFRSHFKRHSYLFGSCVGYSKNLFFFTLLASPSICATPAVVRGGGRNYQGVINDMSNYFDNPSQGDFT